MKRTGPACRVMLSGLTMLLAFAARAEAGVGMPDLAARHCQACHGVTRLAYERHTTLGWWWTIQRMRWVNGAAIPAKAVMPLARGLAATYPAEGADAGREYAVPVLAGLATCGGLAWLGLRRRRRD